MASLRELFAGVRSTFGRAQQNDDLSEASVEQSSKLPGTHADAPDYGARVGLVREDKVEALKEAFETYNLDTTNLLHDVQSPEMVDLLIKHGADVNQVYKESAITENDPPSAYRGRYDLTPLQVAALHADGPTINALIAKGADVDAGRLDDHTHPLAMALGRQDGQEETVVRTLLDAGANVDGIAVIGEAAARKASIETMTMLLEAGANPNDVSDGHREAISHAAGQGRLDAVDLLLDYGAKVDGVDDFSPEEKQEEGFYNFTPLQEAAVNGHMNVVDRLVERGADPAGVNSLDHLGNHMIARATARGSDEAVDAMINHGADISLALKSPVMKDIPRDKLDPRIVSVQESKVLRQTLAEATQEQAPDIAEAPAPRRRMRL